jgi:hypothetical protein
MADDDSVSLEDMMSAVAVEVNQGLLAGRDPGRG